MKTTFEVQRRQDAYSSLIEKLNQMADTLAALASELPKINDEDFRPKLESLVEVGRSFIGQHTNPPKPSIASDAASVLSAIKALKIPNADPDLGVTPTLLTLRQSRALLYTDFDEISTIAAAAGVIALADEDISNSVGTVDKNQLPGILGGISGRLDALTAEIRLLHSVPEPASPFRQQKDLVDSYSNSMASEVKLANLHISISDSTVDLLSLTRTVDTMSTLTGDFVSTVRAWHERVPEQLVATAGKISRALLRVVEGVSSAVRWVLRRPKLQKSKDDGTPWVGSLLRERREAMRLTIADVRKATYISRDYLRAIEADRYHALPGWAYVVGYVTTYADFLGLDGRDVAEQLKSWYSQSNESPWTRSK